MQRLLYSKGPLDNIEWVFVMIAIFAFGWAISWAWEQRGKQGIEIEIRLPDGLAVMYVLLFFATTASDIIVAGFVWWWKG